MTVNIYGLTEATISFNTLGITLRGKAPTDPGSIARNLTITDPSQQAEIQHLANIGLIGVEEVATPDPEVFEQPIFSKAPKEESPVKEKSRRRPKLKPNAKPKGKTAKKANDRPEGQPAPQPEVITQAQKDAEESSTCIVMTETGPRGGDMTHKTNGEINENDSRCEASMKAAKQLEDEEDGIYDLPEPVDESLLDPSEQMGLKAVIGTGGGENTKESMKNTILGDRKEPNFIDLGLDDDAAVENAFDDEPQTQLEAQSGTEESCFIDLGNDEVSKEEAFIDDSDEEGSELDDSFIEI